MRLNNRIIIKKRATGQDSAGQPLQGWIEVGPVWGDVNHQSGAQAIRGDKPTSTVQVSIKVRQRADITAGMRVEDGASIFEIEAVLPDRRSRQFMYLVCKGSK